MRSLRAIWNKFFGKKKNKREFEIRRDAWGRLQDSSYPSNYRVSWNDRFESYVLHDLIEVPREDRRFKEEFEREQWKKFKKLQKEKEE